MLEVVTPRRYLRWLGVAAYPTAQSGALTVPRFPLQCAEVARSGAKWGTRATGEAVATAPPGRASEGDDPTGVHRRVPALGGRQGPCRRARPLPRPARRRSFRVALDRPLSGRLSAASLGGSVRQGRAAARR